MCGLGEIALTLLAKHGILNFAYIAEERAFSCALTCAGGRRETSQLRRAGRQRHAVSWRQTCVPAQGKECAADAEVPEVSRLRCFSAGRQ